MAKLKSKKIPASTLIEVIIAMMIIMVVFSIAIGLYFNIMNSTVSHRKLQAQKQVQVLLQKARLENAYPEETLQIDSISYSFSSSSSSQPAMEVLEIKASLNGRTLTTMKTLIFKTDEER